MMPPDLGTGSQLDGLLPASAAIAPRPPESDVQAARLLAAQITPATMETFFTAVRTQTHNQLEALAFVLQEEYPNRITDQVTLKRTKEQFAGRLVALRREVTTGSPGVDDALRATENRLEWVRKFLTTPAPAATTAAPVTAPVVIPPQLGFFGSFFSGITTQVMSMVNGRPATPQQVTAVQTQTSKITENLAEAGERILDSLVATPELVGRIPLIGGALAAPINILGSLMGSTPDSRRERAERRAAERVFRTALAANGVTCVAPGIDSLTWAALKGPNPTTPVNIAALMQAWVKVQRENGVTGPLTIASAAELGNIETLRKQLQDKRAVEARATLITNIGTKLRTPIATLTNGSDVQMQSGPGGIALTARVGDLTAAAPVLGAAPTATPTTAPAGIRDFDDAGNPITPEAKTLAGAMRKLPRTPTTKIRIVASGNIEMTNPNEFVVPVGSFDENGIGNNDAKTLVGMTVRFATPPPTKLKVVAAGGNYEKVNSTEYTAVTNGYSESGTPSSDARQFDNAVSTLTDATKITMSTRDNAQIANRTEFVIRPTTRIADLQRLARLASDDAVQTITIDSSMLRRDVPILERRENGVAINTHPEAVNLIVAAGGWNAVFNRMGNNTLVSLLNMRPPPTT